MKEMSNSHTKRSIGRKMRGFVIGISIFAIILTNFISFQSLSNLHKIAEKSLDELGNTAAEDAEQALETQAQRQLLTLATEKAGYIELLFENVAESLHGIAYAAEDIYSNPDQYPDRSVKLPKPESRELAAQILHSERITKENEDLYKTELSKLANIQDLLVQYNRNNDMISSTYVATKTGWMIQADYIPYSKYVEGSSEPLPYEADTRQWYQRAQEAEEGDIVYTDVIEDAHGGGDCIVCAQPVYHDGEIVAVAGVGSYLTVVKDVVIQTAIGESGYAFLVNQYGQIMVSPKEEGETAANTSEGTDVRNSSNERFAGNVQKMVQRESGVDQLELDGKQKYIAYMPLKGVNWSFVAVIDEDEVLELAKDSQNTIIGMKKSANHEMAEQFKILNWKFLLSGLLLVIMTVTLSMYFARRLTKPLLRLKEDVSTIGQGNLDYQIDIHTGDEIEELAASFNQMKKELKNYIASLNQITAEKERIGAELDVAQKIQKDMLPQIFPAFPGRRDFDIYADMQPAKEVGGDFYDFFLVDDRHLAIVIADVSGKGVPAALFMVIAKTLIKNHMQSGETPQQVFYHVNNQLCENNEAGMFVTAWLGLYDFEREVMTCVNAGHNPPVIIDKDDTITFYNQPSGFVLAGFENFEYEQYELPVKAGTKIFVYTDGVTEANNEKEELFGEERLKNSIGSHAAENPQSMVKHVKNEVFSYMGEAAQFDDVTMLCLEIKNSYKWEETIAVDEAMLSTVTEHVETFLEKQCADKRAQTQIAIAIDEICSNVLYYAYPDGNGTLEISLEMLDDSMVKICFKDYGVKYNPLEKEDPDVELLAEEREIGGLGIFMVKNLMDRVEYEYRENKNCLTIYKKIIVGR